MLRKGTDRAYKKGLKDGKAAEEKERDGILAEELIKHEAAEVNTFNRGKYEGLWEAREILDDNIDSEGDDSDDESVHKFYLELNRARRRISRKIDNLYISTHDGLGRTV